MLPCTVNHPKKHNTKLFCLQQQLWFFYFLLKLILYFHLFERRQKKDASESVSGSGRTDTWLRVSHWTERGISSPGDIRKSCFSRTVPLEDTFWIGKQAKEVNDWHGLIHLYTANIHLTWNLHIKKNHNFFLAALLPPPLLLAVFVALSRRVGCCLEYLKSCSSSCQAEGRSCSSVCICCGLVAPLRPLLCSEWNQITLAAVNCSPGECVLAEGEAGGRRGAVWVN